MTTYLVTVANGSQVLEQHEQATADVLRGLLGRYNSTDTPVVIVAKGSNGVTTHYGRERLHGTLRKGDA